MNMEIIKYISTFIIMSSCQSVVEVKSQGVSCPDSLSDLKGVSSESDSMGCLFASNSHHFDTYDKALGHCKELLGAEASLVEILSEKDQQQVLDLIKEAE